MPSKKKKYNARFPPARIKKIMQMDEEVGKVAATVPVIISRALELFIESLIQQATQMTLAKNAKTLSASHLKYIIESQERYRFLKELVASVSDHQMEEDPTPTVNHHNDEEKSPSSSVPGKRPRGRPRKLQDVSQVIQKKERRKRKKESSSSESENSEDTDDADEGTDEDPAPVASSVVSAVSSSSSSTETSGPSSSSSADLPTPSKATTTLSHPLPISELLAQSQEKRSAPELQGESASVESDPAGPQPQQQEVASAVIGSVPAASTFQGTPAMMPAAVPMYQSVAGVAAPNLFAWPNPATVLGGGFPSLQAQGSAFASLQPQGAGFPGMMLPGLGFPAVSPSLMTFQGLPGMGFAGVSPLTPGFSGVSVAGAGLAGVTSKAPATAGTPNGAQGDDDYDT